MIFILMKSILIGLAIAAIVGPISILCIRIGLTKGMKTALISGLGAACADAIYGVIAAFGLITLDSLTSSVTHTSYGFDFWAPLAGSLFMLYLGLKVIFHPPEKMELKEASSRDTAKGFLTIFILTLSNPMTIASFIGIFAGLGITTGENISEKVAVVAGVFLGSALWWLLLAILTSWLRQFFSMKIMLWVNRISGVILLGIPLFLVGGLFGII